MRNLLNIIGVFTLLLSVSIAYSQPTVYMTADDYGKEETKVYAEVVLLKKSLALTSEDGSAKVFNLKNDKVWGFRNNFGEDYRINRAGKALRIIEYGAICIYSNLNDPATTLDPNIDSRWKNNPTGLSKIHSFSIGATGKIIKFSNGRFLKALKEHVAYEQFEKLINSANKELLLKIVEYNASV